MKIISREELNGKLEHAGIIKSPHYADTAEYVYQNSNGSNIAIDDVADPDKERVVSAVVDSLLVLADRLFLFPRYTYFNTENEGRYFHLFDMESLKDEAIEWTKEDSGLINKFMYVHFLKGQHLGWDLYLATSDGSVLALICHHDEFHVKLRAKETGRKLSKLLGERSVEYELNLREDK